MPIVEFSKSEIGRYIENRFRDVRKIQDEWRIPCPLHGGGKRRSLAVNAITGQWWCHGECGRGGSLVKLEAERSGCDNKEAYREICRIVGRVPPSPNGTSRKAPAKAAKPAAAAPSSGGRGKIAAIYKYTNEAGQLLFEVVRFEPKAFAQRRPDGRGRWIWNLGDCRRVLYRLPEVMAAPIVLVCEGERDADTATALGYCGTTCPAGAGKWRPEFTETLRTKSVIVVADADKAGRRHGAMVALSVKPAAASVQVLEMPGAKDLTEWVENGGTSEGLAELIEATPEWEGPPEAAVEPMAEAAAPRMVSVDLGRLKPTVETINAIGLFGGKVRFKAIRRLGPLVQAEFENGKVCTFRTAPDLGTFNKAQMVIFGATGALIPPPPVRKMRIIWEPIAELIRQVADEDAVDLEPDLKDEFAQVLRAVWERAGKPEVESDDNAAFVRILEQCPTTPRNPAGPPPPCAVFVAEASVFVHQPSLMDYLSTPGGKHRHYPWPDVREALLLLGFRPMPNLHRSFKGRRAKASLWQGPLDLLTDDETDMEE